MTPSALIVEPSLPVQIALRKAAEAAGCEVRTAANADEATAAWKDAPALVIASVGAIDGEAVCRAAKAVSPSCRVVLVYPPDETDADARATEAGADACLVGPLKHAAVTSCLRAMLQMRALQERLERLEGQGAEVSIAGGAGVSEVEFFKKTLLMEVKRSRRYRYPVALLLIGVDAFRQTYGALAAPVQQALLAEVLATVVNGIRDIDLAVPSTEGRVLVFLPHTARKGAGVVAGRLRERLAKTSVEGLTASIGVAAYEPKHDTDGAGQAGTQISFGTLMKEATDALARAQQLGGNRVESGENAPRSRISLG